MAGKQIEIVALFNNLKTTSDGTSKLEQAMAIEEKILHRNPQLLPQYLDDVLHLASDPSMEIKRWVTQFIDTVLDSSHLRAHPLPMFTKLGQTLLFLINVDRASYLRKAISVSISYCQKLHPFIIKHGRDQNERDKWQKIWTQIASQIRSRILRLLKQSGENDNIRPACYSYLRDMIMLYSPRPSDTQHLERITSEGTKEKVAQRSAGLDENLIQNNLVLTLQELDQLSERLLRTLIGSLYDSRITTSQAINVLESLFQLAQQRPKLWPILIPRLCKVAKEACLDNVMNNDSEGSEDELSDEERILPFTVQADEAKKVMKDSLLDLLRCPATIKYRNDLMKTLTKLGAYDSMSSILKMHLKVERPKDRKRTRGESERGIKSENVAKKIKHPLDEGPTDIDKDVEEDDEGVDENTIHESVLGRFTVGQLADMVTASLKVLDLSIPIQDRHLQVMKWVSVHQPHYVFNPSLLQKTVQPQAKGLSLKKQLELQQAEDSAALSKSQSYPPYGGQRNLPLQPPPLPPSLVQAAATLRSHQRKFGISNDSQLQCRRTLLHPPLREQVMKGSISRMITSAKYIHTEGIEATRYSYALLGRLVAQTRDDDITNQMLGLIASDPRLHFELLIQWLFIEYQMAAPFEKSQPVAPQVKTFVKGKLEPWEIMEMDAEMEMNSRANPTPQLARIKKESESSHYDPTTVKPVRVKKEKESGPLINVDSNKEDNRIKPENKDDGVEEIVQQAVPEISVSDPIGWLFKHSRSTSNRDIEWSWKGEGDTDGEPTKYSKLLDKVITELAPLLGQSEHNGLLTEVLVQCPHIPLTAFQRLHFDFCMAHSGTKEENNRRMIQGLQCLEAIIQQRPVYTSKALSMVLYYSSSAAQAQVQIMAVRLITNRLVDSPHLKSAILPFAKHSLSRLADLKLPTAEADMDDRAKKKLDSDVQRLVSLCLGLCMKECQLLRYIFMAFTKCEAAVAKRILAIDPFSQLILKLAQKVDAREMLVKLTAGYPPGAEMVSLKIIRMLMDEDDPALRPVQTQIVRAAKFIYKERTKEEDVRFLIPIFSYLNKDELRGRVLDLIVNLPQQLLDVAFSRLLVPTRADILPKGDHDDRVTPVDLIVFLHELSDFKKAATAIQTAFSKESPNGGPAYTMQMIVSILQTLLTFDPLPILLMRTLLQSMSTYPKLVEFVCSRFLIQLIQKNIWENDVLWKGFKKCILDYQPRTFPTILQLPQRHQVGILEQEPTLIVPFNDWLKSPTSPVNKAMISTSLMTFLHQNVKKHRS